MVVSRVTVGAGAMGCTTRERSVVVVVVRRTVGSGAAQPPRHTAPKAIAIAVNEVDEMTEVAFIAP